MKEIEFGFTFIDKDDRKIFSSAGKRDKR